MKTFTLLLALAVFPRMLLALIIHVPADSATIQSAIDGAIAGDTVLVTDNTYYESIDFLGKSITLASEFILDGDSSHIYNTVIDGGGSDAVVSLTSEEDSTTLLKGLTVQNGVRTVDILLSNVVIANCELLDGSVNAEHCYWSGVRLRDTHIGGDNASFVLNDGPCHIYACQIDGNMSLGLLYGRSGDCQIDSSTINGTIWKGSCSLRVHSSTINGNVESWQYASARLYNSTVTGYATSVQDAVLTLDTCIIGKLECWNYGLVYATHSLIQNGCSTSGLALINLRQCNAMGKFSITNCELTLDSCIVVVDDSLAVECLSLPGESEIIAHCTDIYGFTHETWFDSTVRLQTKWTRCCES